MSDDLAYPDDPAGPFPEPPASFTDREGREIELRLYGAGPLESDEDEFESLVEMYATFDPADRAQGLPPAGESDLRHWLEVLLPGGTINVFAWHDGRVVGHATLVPDEAGAYELAIFVHQDYQSAGIGSRLIRHLLGAGADHGVERVWLTVERWNTVAIELYRKVGFETTSPESFELEMGLRL